MAEPRIAIARTGIALGAAMVGLSCITFRLGIEPAWFAVTGLVWGAMLCTVGVGLGATPRRNPDSR